MRDWSLGPGAVRCSGNSLGQWRIDRRRRRASKPAGDLLGQRSGVITALPADVQDRDASGAEDLVNEGVALAAIGASVRRVVKLNDQARCEGGRVDKHEVDTLGLNAPPVRFV